MTVSAPHYEIGVRESIPARGPSASLELSIDRCGRGIEEPRANDQKVAMSGARLRIVSGLGYLLLFGLYLLPAELDPPKFFKDDAFFYPQVANHIVTGEGSTFHTITPTNGYHPLWMVFCVLAAILSGGDKGVALHIIVGMQAALFAATAYYFRKTAELVAIRSAVGLAILAGFLLSTGMYGSEAHLNAFTLMLASYLLVRAELRDERGDWPKVGFCLGLAALARLDNVFVAGSLILVACARRDQSLARIARRLFSVGVPFGIVVAPYLLYNLLSTGHFVTVSGSIKSTFPSITGDIANLGALGQLTAVSGIGALFLALLPAPGARWRTLLGGLGLGVTLHASYVALFTDHYTFWNWYYVAGVLSMALTICVAMGLLESRLRDSLPEYAFRGVSGLMTTVIVIGGLVYAWAKLLPATTDGIDPGWNEYRWHDEFAVWMNDTLPSGSGVLVYDYPGALAYFSDLRVLPADGLINDFVYNDEIVEQGIGEYLCRKDVGFYFGPILEGSTSAGPRGELRISRPTENVQSIEVFAPLSRASAGSIDVRDADRVVSVRDVVRRPEATPALALWKLDTCRREHALSRPDEGA
jgi:hypothetical protein